MKKLMFAVLMLLPWAVVARAGSTFDLHVDLTGLLPGGTVGTSASADSAPRRWGLTELKRSLNGNPVINHWSNLDTGPTNFYWKVVTSADCPSGCLQKEYPVGSVGMAGGLKSSGWGHQMWGFQVRGAPDMVSAEWDWEFLPGWDFGRLGKLGITIGSETYRLRVNWSPGKKPSATAKFDCYMTNKRNGSYDLRDKAKEPTWAIATGVWYHFHLQFTNGPAGPWNIWIKRPGDPDPGYQCMGLQASDIPPARPVEKANNITIESSTFFGGTGKGAAAHADSFSLMKNVHIYSGSG